MAKSELITIELISSETDSFNNLSINEQKSSDLMKIPNLIFVNIMASKEFNSSIVTIGKSLTSEPFLIGLSSLALSAINRAVRKRRRHVYVCKETRVASLNLDK